VDEGWECEANEEVLRFTTAYLRSFFVCCISAIGDNKYVYAYELVLC
jgi:hypothetical protein